MPITRRSCRAGRDGLRRIVYCSSAKDINREVFYIAERGLRTKISIPETSRHGHRHRRMFKIMDINYFGEEDAPKAAAHAEAASQTDLVDINGGKKIYLSTEWLNIRADESSVARSLRMCCAVQESSDKVTWHDKISTGAHERIQCRSHTGMINSDCGFLQTEDVEFPVLSLREERRSF